jgi:DNA-binding transcriptional LysR family regulator
MQYISIMEMRHLKYFIAVAEELHFGRAAQRLNMCQPPLSQQIKNLEMELGAALFIRKNKRTSLTEAGLAFLEDAREILRKTDLAADRVRRIERGIIGRVSLGFVLPAMSGFLPDAVREFRSQNPEVEVQLSESSTSAQLASLKAGSLDAGVVRLFQQDTSGLRVAKIAAEPYVLAVPGGHRLAALGKVPLAALDGETLIMFPRASQPALHDTILACLGAAQCRPRITQEATAKVTMVALAAAGIGVALVPESAKKAPRTGVVYRDIIGDLPMVEFSLVWRDDAQSKALMNLVDTILAMREA